MKKSRSERQAERQARYEDRRRKLAEQRADLERRRAALPDVKFGDLWREQEEPGWVARTRGALDRIGSVVMALGAVCCLIAAVLWLIWWMVL